jgi:hypothetical protein
LGQSGLTRVRTSIYTTTLPSSVRPLFNPGNVTFRLNHPGFSLLYGIFTMIRCNPKKIVKIEISDLDLI